MEDINRDVACRDAEKLQSDSNKDAAAAYRKLLGQIECPQEVRQAVLKGCMEQQATGKKAASLRRWRYAAMVACSLLTLCIMGGIIFGRQVGYALGRDHRQGYIYEEVEYEGLEFTKTFVVFSRWNQNVALSTQSPTGQYKGCYEDLQQLGLLDVLLPHYRVDVYEQEQREIYSEPDYKAWYATYRDGDSRISMKICHAAKTSAQSAVGMPKGHEMISVDGIEYDVQYYSRKADYEEYVQMQEYNSQGDEEKQILSREEYEGENFYPIQIECMVNRVYYCFQLTGDIDMQEFLESIHTQTPDMDAAAIQTSAPPVQTVTPPAREDIKTPELNVSGRRGIAYEYTEVEFQGLELTSCYMDRDFAEQKIAVNTQQPENQYAGAYEDLKALNMLEVLLPHYQVERYSLSDSGNREIQFEREWYGIYEDGDSWISMTLQELGTIMATKSTDMLSGHESRTVNGVQYEILYYPRPITYDEYLLMQQYRVEHSYEAWSCSRIEYEESYFYYPVEIICVVNGVKYQFNISGDVDLEEFLESIY